VAEERGTGRESNAPTQEVVVLGSLGLGEILLLAVVGLVLFGPERLPSLTRDVVKVVRQLRQMATDASNEISSELGPELADLDLRSLNPRTLINEHLFGDDEPSTQTDRNRTGRSEAARHPASKAVVSLNKSEGGSRSRDTPFDVDAT